MKTVIIIPSEYEYDLIEKSSIKQFDYARVSGMGKVKALICAAELIYHYKVDRILLFGLAGSLRNLKLGQIIEPNIFIEGDYTDPIANEINLVYSNSEQILNYSTICSIVSQDRFLYDNPYPFANSPLSTDMESYALAKFCKETGIEFKCIKIISDIVGENNKNFSQIANSYRLAMNLCLSEIGDSLCELR